MLGNFFDPRAEFAISQRLRPHWSQAGAIVFITFRTRDSIPRSVIEQWDREKNEWLDRRNLRNGRHWSDVVDELKPETSKEFRRRFNRTREDFLDKCQGSCVLRDKELAGVVARSLMHFDGDRYQMGDFVVMPNHVHLLAAFPSQAMMERQLSSWLHFTAREINRKTGRSGRFWQQEPFDHLVRNIDQYDYLRCYIEDNPKKAKLKDGEYWYYRRADD